MGLAAANSEASWRTWGGTLRGVEVAIRISYGMYDRKIYGENQAFKKSSILVVYALRDLLDCKANINFAYQIYSEQEGFKAWSTFNNGASC